MSARTYSTVIPMFRERHSVDMICEETDIDRGSFHFFLIFFLFIQKQNTAHGDKLMSCLES